MARAAAVRARPASRPARRGAATAPVRRPRAATQGRRASGAVAPVRKPKAAPARKPKAALGRAPKAAPARKPKAAPAGAPLAIRVAHAPFLRAAHGRVNRMLDALLHGQGWIALVGVLLAGIVFFNVDLLQMNRDIAGTAQRATGVKHENARLRLQLARLASTERIQRAAVSQGLLLPAPGDVRYLRANPMIDSRLAARRMVPPGSQGVTNAPAPESQATPVSAPAPAAAPPQAQAQSAPAATATPPSTPAPAPITPPAAAVPTAGAGTTAAPTG